jgi:signal transduction histidine kinase
MQSTNSQESSRVHRLFSACQRGLNHDLTNQLVALQGLLQLLEMDESERLSTTGKEYLKRLKGVGHRTLHLARTLRDLIRLVGAPARAEIVPLPQVVDDLLDSMVPPPARKAEWDEPRVWAPPERVRHAFALALALLAEAYGTHQTFFQFIACQRDGLVECTISPNLAEETGTLLNAAERSLPLPNPEVWHDKLECVLLRELVESWGGTAAWHWQQTKVSVTLTFPPPMSPSA